MQNRLKILNSLARVERNFEGKGRGGGGEGRKKEEKKKKESSKPRSAVRKSVGSGKTKEETRLNLPSLCSRLVGCSKEPFYASGTKEFDKVKSK